MWENQGVEYVYPFLRVFKQRDLLINSIKAVMEFLRKLQLLIDFHFIEHLNRALSCIFLIPIDPDTVLV